MNKNAKETKESGILAKLYKRITSGRPRGGGRVNDYERHVYLIKNYFYLIPAPITDISLSVRLFSENINRDPYDAAKDIIIELLCNPKLEYKELKVIRWIVHLLSIGYLPPTAITIYHFAKMLEVLSSSGSSERAEQFLITSIREQLIRGRGKPSERRKAYRIPNNLLDLILGLGFASLWSQYIAIQSKMGEEFSKQEKRYKVILPTFIPRTLLLLLPHETIASESLPVETIEPVIKASFSVKRNIIKDLIYSNELSLTKMYLDYLYELGNNLVENGIDSETAKTMTKYAATALLTDIYIYTVYLVYYNIIDIDLPSLLGRAKLIKKGM